MKDIKGYEGLYAITEDGQVWSYRKKIFLKSQKAENGYLRVMLYKKGEKRWQPFIHRLVLETFKPVDEMEKLQVNHCNEIKTDNRLENLSWTTAKENCNFGTHNQRVATALSKKVRCIETGVIYNSINEAAEAIGKAASSLSNCLAGRRKTCGGFHWEFVD